MAKTIEPVKPRVFYRHYSRPDCQGTLICETAGWPRIAMRLTYYEDCFGLCRSDVQPDPHPTPVPTGLDIGDAYLDRMRDWDYDKLEKAWVLLDNGFDSSDDALIAFCRAFFELDVVAVRTVYYFNVATGYDCPRIDYLFRPKANKGGSNR